jgi:hypothetical protein
VDVSHQGHIVPGGRVGGGGVPHNRFNEECNESNDWCSKSNEWCSRSSTRW